MARYEVPKSEKLKLLDALVPAYALNKGELDSYKKICDRENSQIKDIMTTLALQHYEVEGYKINCVTQHREKLDEDVLISIIRNAPGIEYLKSDIIKTKEYIDFDALEKAIYDGKISDDLLLEMDKAKEIKDVVTLKVTKLKKKEEK